MKIIVVISQTQDTEAKIGVASSGDAIDTSAMKWILNPYDEFAIEEALKKELTGDTLKTFSVIGKQQKLIILLYRVLHLKRTIVRRTQIWYNMRTTQKSLFRCPRTILLGLWTIFFCPWTK